MDSLTSKAAYLKGLCDGMELDGDKAANKLIVKIIDAISDIAAAVDDVCDAHDELEELVQDIDEDLRDLEDFVYDDNGLFDDDDEEQDDDDFDLLDYDDDEDMGFFEIQCPNCNEDVMVDFETLDDDAPIVCPNCHQEIELEFDCDCGCDDCGEHHGEE